MFREDLNMSASFMASNNTIIMADGVQGDELSMSFTEAIKNGETRTYKMDIGDINNIIEIMSEAKKFLSN